MKTLMISVCAALVACACAAEDAPKPAAAPVAPAAPAAPAAAKPVDPAAANRARARRARADLRRPRSGASARVKVSPFGKLKDGTPHIAKTINNFFITFIYLTIKNFIQF